MVLSTSYCTPISQQCTHVIAPLCLSHTHKNKEQAGSNDDLREGLSGVSQLHPNGPLMMPRGLFASHDYSRFSYV